MEEGKRIGRTRGQEMIREGGDAKRQQEEQIPLDSYWIKWRSAQKLWDLGLLLLHFLSAIKQWRESGDEMRYKERKREERMEGEEELNSECADCVRVPWMIDFSLRTQFTRYRLKEDMQTTPCKRRFKWVVVIRRSRVSVGGRVFDLILYITVYIILYI